jgi:hypothetical protein
VKESPNQTDSPEEHLSDEEEYSTTNEDTALDAALENIGDLVAETEKETEKVKEGFCGMTTTEGSGFEEKLKIQICMGDMNTDDDNQTQSCNEQHNNMIWCPLKNGLSPTLALMALHDDPGHTLDEGCIISTVLQEEGEHDTMMTFNNRNQTATVLAARIARQNKADLKEINGKSLSQTQMDTIRKIFKTFLEPWSDPTSRCTSCLKCTSCAPIQLLN